MKPNSRTMWKLLAVLGSVLVVGAVTLGLLVGKMQERKEYVGSVDPTSGYRCRFTLSSSWQKYDGLIQCYPPEVDEEDLFCPMPPNPMMSWIARRLFHHVLPSENSPIIALMRLRPSAKMFHIRDGYPEVIWGNPPSPNISQRHLQIDGFPATVVTHTNKYYRGTWLIVSVPDCPVAYVVTACDTPADMGKSSREMQAIIASFHVEKVPVLSGGKR